jgi:hypothetical protein
VRSKAELARVFALLRSQLLLECGNDQVDEMPNARRARFANAEDLFEWSGPAVAPTPAVRYCPG